MLQTCGISEDSVAMDQRSPLPEEEIIPNGQGTTSPWQVGIGRAVSETDIKESVDSERDLPTTQTVLAPDYSIKSQLYHKLMKAQPAILVEETSVPRYCPRPI
jgi:hypothetical protein